MFDALLLAAGGVNPLWFALPLVVTVSLVYAATRHEDMGPIVRHAARFGLLVVVVMGILLAILFVMSWWVSVRG